MNNRLGWRIGCQAYSFRHFTFLETIDKNAALGLRCIEAYPGQALGHRGGNAVFDHNCSPEELDAVRARLDSAGVQLVNYGVVGLPNDETECRRVFEFAKAMGIETLVSEPPFDAWDLVDRLCQEYRVYVAIHNHPAPSLYWNPETVVKACEGRSGYVGACADTGHWIRSGIDPLAALKSLEGRIVSLHLKDVDREAPEAQDVPWGTGIGRVEELLLELNRQDISPVFSIEYVLESDADPSADIGECVRYFNGFRERIGRV